MNMVKRYRSQSTCTLQNINMIKHANFLEFQAHDKCTKPTNRNTHTIRKKNSSEKKDQEVAGLPKSRP